MKHSAVDTLLYLLVIGLIAIPVARTYAIPDKATGPEAPAHEACT